MTCTPTALCAATGRSRLDVQQAIREASGNHIWQETDRCGAKPSHWAKALKLLGFQYKVEEIEPRSINEFMRRSTSQEVILIVAVDPSSDDEAPGHVFAAQENQFVDYYSNGKIEKFHGVPDDLKGFQVKYVVRVGL